MASVYSPRIPYATVLDTPRCILRYPNLEDAPRLLSAFTSDRFPGDVPLGQIESLDGVNEWLERVFSAWQEGSAFTWTILEKETILLLGQVTLTFRSEPDIWALAYWVHPECWGKGYATEAARRILEFGFLELRASLIWAGVTHWNERSIRVVERLGLRYVRDHPEGYEIIDKKIPIREYEITRSEWEQARGVGS
jgi:ribosomal-protein-alanine N-acetyltransferase